MYRWYRDADICFAFLPDTPSLGWFNENKSRWFTRGWTLQELLAPREVIFLSDKWQQLGTRSKLASRIKTLTSIPTRVLTGEKPIYEASLAQRMT